MLVLVGSGEYLPEVDQIDLALFERIKEPVKVVCLPTAAGKESEQSIQSWMDKGVNHYTRLGVEVEALPVVDQKSARDAGMAKTIEGANFVYLSGGHPGYLAESLEGSPVWEAILSVHAAGGVVAGCSAGAMIMGERISGPGGNRPGFNLLPGTVIMPHFDEFPGMISRFVRLFSQSRLTMVGIDGRTGLVVDNGRYEVMGQGQVTIMGPQGTEKFAAGPLDGGI